MKPSDATTQGTPSAIAEMHTQQMRTVTDNLSDVRTRICRLLACDYIHTETLAELYANAYMQDGTDAIDAPALAVLNDLQYQGVLQEALGADTAPPVDVALAHHASMLDGIHRQLTTAEQLCFFRALTSDTTLDTTALTARLFGRTEPLEQDAYGKVVYQHSI